MKEDNRTVNEVCAFPVQGFADLNIYDTIAITGYPPALYKSLAMAIGGSIVLGGGTVALVLKYDDLPTIDEALEVVSKKLCSKDATLDMVSCLETIKKNTFIFQSLKDLNKALSDGTLTNLTYIVSKTSEFDFKLKDIDMNYANKELILLNQIKETYKVGFTYLLGGKSEATYAERLPLIPENTFNRLFYMNVKSDTSEFYLQELDPQDVPINCVSMDMY